MQVAAQLMSVTRRVQAHQNSYAGISHLLCNRHIYTEREIEKLYNTDCDIHAVHVGQKRSQCGHCTGCQRDNCGSFKARQFTGHTICIPIKAQLLQQVEHHEHITLQKTALHAHVLQQYCEHFTTSFLIKLSRIFKSFHCACEGVTTGS